MRLLVIQGRLQQVIIAKPSHAARPLLAGGIILLIGCFSSARCVSATPQLLSPKVGQGQPQKIAVINFQSAESATSSPTQASAPSPAQSPTAITVTAFTPRAGEQQAWLSKGLADLLIQALSEVQSLAVVEREQMQAFTREAELQGSALFSHEQAVRVGRVAKVQQVIYGNYTLAAERVTIAIFLLDLQTQEILQKEELTGALKDLRTLVQTLVFQLLKHRGVALSRAEREKIQYTATDSITATEHFYRAIDFYDRGEYPDAFGEFAAATLQDPRFFEARLWMGRMFEALGDDEQAVLTYRTLFRNAPGSVEALDALFFAGQVLELKRKRLNEAMEAYLTLTSIRPITPHGLEAAFRLALLFEEQGRDLEAYREFQIVDDFRTHVEQHPARLLRSLRRASRFLKWGHALSLYQDSVVHMIVAYQRLTEQLEPAQLPTAPRGTFTLKGGQSTVSEPFGKTPSLFHHERFYPDWREEFYVVVAPKGYVATGVELTITGQLLNGTTNDSYHIRVQPFPLPRNYLHSWLGMIYGQTPQVSTLRKTVSFYGEPRKVLTVQLGESHAKIISWGLRAILRPDSVMAQSPAQPPAREDGDLFWEGKPLGMIPFPEGGVSGSTRPSADVYYAPQKELALVSDRRGALSLVFVRGELDGEQTDLWFSRSPDGVTWSQSSLLPINSASEDYNPRLICAEDGTIWLAWISTRRGMGWELWLSHSKDGQTWSSPNRVPLEQFVSKEHMPGKRSVTELLEYDILQDRRGQWMVVCSIPDTRETVVLRSSDAKAWNLLWRTQMNQAIYGPSLAEDHSAIYRLAALGADSLMYLWSSNDGESWRASAFVNDPGYDRLSLIPTVDRTQLFPLADGRVVLIVGDSMFGLQYARFHPDAGKPLLDLVSRTGLEAFAAAALPSGEYLLALKEADGIHLQRYREFNTTGKDVEHDTRDWPIYVETEQDRHGNTWRRSFARARIVISDVTALGVEPTGRVWWGIETGIMSKQGEEFFATDVSQGFFYHYVTELVGCPGPQTWFAAKDLPQPMVGHVLRPPSPSVPPEFQTRWVPGVKGSITAVQCGAENGELYAGTSTGEIVGFNGSEVFMHQVLASNPRVAAIALNQQAKDLWVGTSDHGVFQLHGSAQRHFDHTTGLAADEVTALAIDAQGAVWVALLGHGLMRYDQGAWTSFTPENAAILYSSIGWLVPDLKKGIWYLPHPEVRSLGLGYFDGQTALAMNPPHRLLERPSALAIDPHGHLWIGTAFDGLYEFEQRSSVP